MKNYHLMGLLSGYGKAYSAALQANGRYGTKEAADMARKRIIQYVQRKVRAASTKANDRG